MYDNDQLKCNGYVDGTQHRCKTFFLRFFYSCHVLKVFNVFFYFPFVFKIIKDVQNLLSK